MNKRMSRTKEDFIINLYVNKGYSQQRIAKVLKTYNTSIRRVLLRNNIELRDTRSMCGYGNKNPFDLRNRMSNYFIGLLIADGSISNGKLSLGLKEEDKYILKSFAFFINARLNRYYNSHHKEYQYYVMKRSSSIIKYLEGIANFNNKGKEAELYIDLNWDIFRGILDGDGSFVETNGGSTLRMSIASGSLTLSKQIYNFLISEGLSPRLSKSKSDVYYVNIDRRDSLIKLYENMYSNGNCIKIERKYNLLATYVKRFM